MAATLPKARYWSIWMLGAMAVIAPVLFGLAKVIEALR